MISAIVAFVLLAGVGILYLTMTVDVIVTLFSDLAHLVTLSIYGNWLGGIAIICSALLVRYSAFIM